MDPQALLANCKTVLGVFYTAMKRDIAEYSMRRVHLKLPQIPASIIEAVLQASEEMFAKEPNIIQIQGPTFVVGDLNGSILDLFQILARCGTPPQASYLFLGNVCGGGEFSTETLMMLFIMHILWPQNVMILRGCHEFWESAKESKISAELTQIYGSDGLLKGFHQVFNALPLAALISESTFCVHGGIGPSICDFSSIMSIRRPVISLDSPEIIDIMCSDAMETLPMFLPTRKGKGGLFGSQALSAFLARTHAKCLVMGRQCAEGGTKSVFDGILYTVCSCSLGQDEGSQYAVLKCNGDRFEEVRFNRIPIYPRSDASSIELECHGSKAVFPSTLLTSRPLKMTLRHSSTGSLPHGDEILADSPSTSFIDVHNFRRIPTGNPGKRIRRSEKSAPRMMGSYLILGI